MLIGEMKQSIKTTEENCKEIFKYLHEMRTEGLPVCKSQIERVEKLEGRVGRVEMGLVRLLLAMIGSGVCGGAAGEILRNVIGG
jgi:hypothetical protein